MLIDRNGLFYGDRIGACSDEAQLHFPRLLVASNGYGRIEMSYSKIISTVYGNFKKKPTNDEIKRWLYEYFENFLLFVYRANDGSVWGQWDVPGTMLPKYKREECKRSPSPDESALAAYRASYVASRRVKYAAHDDVIDFSDISKKTDKLQNYFQNTSETSEALPNSSEVFQNVSAREERRGVGIGTGIGVGIGTGIGEVHMLDADASSPKLATNLPDDDSVERVYQAYPRKVGRIKALVAIRKAVTALSTGKSVPAMPTNDALRFLHGKAREFALSPAGQQGEFTPHPSTWFNEGRYLDDPAEWQRAGQQRGGSNGKGNGGNAGESAASARNRRSIEGIRAVAARYRTGPVSGADGANQTELSRPGDSTRDCRDVVPGLDGAGGEVRERGNGGSFAGAHDGVEILPSPVRVAGAAGGSETRAG